MFPFRSSFTIVERSLRHRSCTVAKSYLKFDRKTIVKHSSVHVRGFQVSTPRGLARSWEAATNVSPCAALSLAVAAGGQKSYARARIDTQ